MVALRCSLKTFTSEGQKKNEFSVIFLCKHLVALCYLKTLTTNLSKYLLINFESNQSIQMEMKLWRLLHYLYLEWSLLMFVVFCFSLIEVGTSLLGYFDWPGLRTFRLFSSLLYHCYQIKLSKKKKKHLGSWGMGKWHLNRKQIIQAKFSHKYSQARLKFVLKKYRWNVTDKIGPIHNHKQNEKQSKRFKLLCAKNYSCEKPKWQHIQNNLTLKVHIVIFSLVISKCMWKPASKKP